MWKTGEKADICPTVQGTVVGCKSHGKQTIALVDEGDVHTLMIGAAGVGKTAFFLYPNIEFACASGMSFLQTDTKGDVFRNYGSIAKKYYDYNVSVLVYATPHAPMKQYPASGEQVYGHLSDRIHNLSAKAKAEKYAKITAKTIISIGGGDAAAYGANAFFYDAAEGLLASLILLLAEFGEKNERHIVSVFKMIQDLLEPVWEKQSVKKTAPKSGFKALMERLPDEHKAEVACRFRIALCRSSEVVGHEYSPVPSEQL